MNRRKLYFATADGRRRILDRLDQARVNESRFRLERTNIAGEFGMATSRAREEQMRAMDTDYANAVRVRSQLEQIISEWRPDTAPEPKDTEQVQISHVVRLKCTDCARGREHEEIIQIGGHGEDCDEMTPKVRGYTTPLCLQLLKKERGDEVSYRVERKEHTALILDIWLPDEYRRMLQAA